MYSAVDNYNLSLILNKLFSEDTYSYYLHPFLCWGIGGLSELLPTADVYLLCSHFCIVIAISLLFYISLSSALSLVVRGGLLIYIASMSVLLNIWSNNYTIQAGLFSTVGMVWLLHAVSKPKVINILLGTLFLCLGYMWRAEGFWLIIPFATLHALTDIFLEIDRKAKLRNLVKVFGVFVLCLIVLVTSREIINNSAQYSPSIHYSNARTVIQDYPVLPYDGANSLFSDISEIEYRAAVNWSLFDTENINTELFEKIGEVASTTKYAFSVNGIMCAFKDMLLLIWQHKLIMFGIGSFFLFVLLLLCSLDKKQRWIRIIQLLLYVAGTMLILLYFTMKGRAPLHVWLTVLTIAMIMAGFILGSGSYKQLPQSASLAMGFIPLLVVMLVVVKYAQSDVNVPKFALTSRVDNYAEEFAPTYTDDESVFIWGAWHREITHYYMSSGKLPSAEFMGHNISAGDWTYGQYYFIDYLDGLGIANPAEALITREKTYLVDDDCTFVLEYLRQVYDDQVYAVQVDSINEIPVWQFLR